MVANGEGERIGVAYVDIEGRLDRLMADLAEVDRATSQTMRRVRESATAVSEGVSEVGDASDEAGIGLTHMASIGLLFRKIWKDGLGETISGVRQLGTTGAAATAIFARLGVAIVAALPPLVLLLAIVAAAKLISSAVEGIADTVDALGNAWNLASATMSSDAATAAQAVRDLSDELARIPLIGQLVAGRYQEFMGRMRDDTQQVAEGIARVRGFFRDFPILGHLVRLGDDAKDAVLGHADAIEKSLENSKALRAEWELYGRIARETNRYVLSGLNDEISLRNQLELLRASGVDKVRVAEDQRMEAERRSFAESKRMIEEKKRADLQAIQDRLDLTKTLRPLINEGRITDEEVAAQYAARGLAPGEIGEADAAKQAARIKAAYKAQSDALEQAEQRSRIHSQQLRDERIAAAVQADRDETQRLADAEAKKAEAQRTADEKAMRSRFQNLRTLHADLQSMQMELEGRTADAQAHAIRAGFQTQIENAIIENDRQRAELLARIRDQRIRQVYENERKVAEAEVAARREESTRIFAELASIDRDIRRGQLDQDDRAGLEAFDINADTDERVRRITDRIRTLREEMAKLREGGVTGTERDQLALIAQQIEMLEMVGERLEVLRGVRLGNIDVEAAALASGRSSQEFAAVNANRFAINGQQGTQDKTAQDRQKLIDIATKIEKNTRSPTARLGT